LPKLKVQTIRDLKLVEEILEIEQAKYLVHANAHVVVEGQRINTYDELVQMVNQDGYRDREYLEVVLLPIEVAGGG
jgi:hypothetical protein